MPYTAFYAKKSYIEKNSETIKSFTKAINKGLNYVKTASNEDIADIIYKQFPDTSLTDLTLLVKRYKDNDSWLDSSYISEKLLENLEDIMIDNDLLQEYVSYQDLIINYE